MDPNQDGRGITAEGRERIGFDRVVRLRWLERTAMVCREHKSYSEIRTALLAYLAAEVEGEKARQNTAGVLTRIWWRVPDGHRGLRDEALAMWTDLDVEGRLGLHWGMSLLAFALFRDIATTTGRLLRLQGSLTPGQVMHRVGSAWARPATLKQAIPRVLRSLRDWGVLNSAGESRTYRAGAAVIVDSPELALWLFETVLGTSGASRPAHDLLRASELFPFVLPISVGDLLRSSRFQCEAQGQDLWMAHRAVER